jgi:hypothetical protein
MSKSFKEILAERIEETTGEKPMWFTKPWGEKRPEPKQVHLERAKRLSMLIDQYRTPVSKMGNMGI